MKKLILVLMAIVIAMTATPIVIFSNSIEPYILGVPLFVFWNLLWPTLLFVLTLIYTAAANKEEKNEGR